VPSVFGGSFGIALRIGREKKTQDAVSDCGYEIDELNESQPVCPQCGTDPYDPELRARSVG